MPAGRPTKYTEKLGQEICSELSLGASLRTVCKPDNRPCVATIFNWFSEHEEFLEQYARAKEEAADMLVEDILDIADDGTNDYMDKLDEEETVSYRFNGEHVQRSKLRVDTRKWIASKLKPKKYGDKVHNVHTGEDGGPIVTKTLAVNGVSPKKD